MKIKGYLLHVTHYDPTWIDKKDREQPFDKDVALLLVEELAHHGMNLLIIDCKDGVAYERHPELRRPYTVPMDAVRQIADQARGAGMDVVPKLNFAKSGRNRHDMWMRPHAAAISWTVGMDNYYAVAADCIGELVDAMKPRTYFHIGMDEDHYRSTRRDLAPGY